MEYTWTIGQFIVGILIAAAGFILVWKADWFLRNFGSIPSAEKYLGMEGGSRLFYKLIGILALVLGIMHATGLLAPLGHYLVNLFFGRTKQQ